MGSGCSRYATVAMPLPPARIAGITAGECAGDACC